ncbi:alcohol dehydrogenase catalytic domain-containing protein [candidate division KSB1 bacterium]|nr:alcohol dehydrogenase catalytic domain-containing protein [candidate division KSB1 bacterium]
MKAIRLNGPHDLQAVDEPEPQISAGQVLLQIEAVGVCGSDIHRYRGVTFENENSRHPLILGHEFAATVIKTGAECRRLRPGDRVAVEAGIHCGQCEFCLRGDLNLCPHIRFCGVPPYDGALRERMAWPEHLLFPLRADLDFEDGVMCEIFGIALHSLDLANLRPGFSAAVLGCGPIGGAILHLLAKTAGAAQLVATDLLDYRCEFARRLGADRVWNANRTAVVDEILDHTHGRGVDAVFECAGVQETLSQAVQVCAPGGKVIWVGIPESDTLVFPVSPARRKGLTIRMVRRSRRSYERSLHLLEKGVIETDGFVTHRFPLLRTAEAFQMVEDYRDGVIKAVVQPSRLH